MTPGTSLPDAIIAGTNKAGTTSLFRYLADHPGVCASRVKEVLFFSRLEGDATDDEVTEYATFFAHCSGDDRVRLEASPTYLAGGGVVARRIRAVLPEVRLIFLLREPADRLLSAFRRKSQRNDPTVARMTQEDYVDTVIGQGEQSAQVRSVCYARHLREYLEVFPADRMLVLFFDDLRQDSARCARQASDFIGIDPAFYDDYAFRIENKTREYRFRGLQKLAHRVNMGLEPVFNRMPALRRSLRDAYNRLNEVKRPRRQPAVGDEASRQRLEQYFSAHNDDLGRLLAERYPEIRLPQWLRPVAADDSRHAPA